MTNQYNNYIPLQDIPVGLEGVNPIENISEIIELDETPITGPIQTMSESVGIDNTPNTSPIQTMSESVGVTVT